MPFQQQARFNLENYPSFTIEKIQGNEAINTCPQWQIQVTATQDEVINKLDAANLFMDAKATLYLADDNNHRTITGIVTAVGLSKEESFWSLGFESKLCLLKYYQEDDIFVNKSLKEICTFILKKVYKKNTCVFLDPSCKYPILPFVIKKDEDGLSFFKRLMLVNQFIFYVDFTSSGEECIYICKQLKAQDPVYLNVLSKEIKSTQVNKKIQRNYKLETCGIPLSLRSQVYIPADYQENPPLFITKQSYTLNLINQNLSHPVSAQLCLEAQPNTEIFFPLQKIEGSFPVAIQAMVEGEQDLIPDLDNNARYKVWIPSLYEGSNKTPVYFRVQLIRKYLNKKAGLFAPLVKGTWVILQWPAEHFATPFIVASFNPPNEKSLVTADNPQELYLKHPEGAQCLLAPNTCYLSTNPSLSNASSLYQDSQEIRLQAQQIYEKTPDKKTYADSHKEFFAKVESVVEKKSEESTKIISASNEGFNITGSIALLLNLKSILDEKKIEEFMLGANSYAFNKTNVLYNLITYLLAVYNLSQQGSVIYTTIWFGLVYAFQIQYSRIVNSITEFFNRLNLTAVNRKETVESQVTKVSKSRGNYENGQKSIVENSEGYLVSNKPEGVGNNCQKKQLEKEGNQEKEPINEAENRINQLNMKLIKNSKIKFKLEQDLKKMRSYQDQLLISNPQMLQLPAKRCNNMYNIKKDNEKIMAIKVKQERNAIREGEADERALYLKSILFPEGSPFEIIDNEKWLTNECDYAELLISFYTVKIQRTEIDYIQSFQQEDMSTKYMVERSEYLQTRQQELEKNILDFKERFKRDMNFSEKIKIKEEGREGTFEQTRVIISQKEWMEIMNAAKESLNRCHYNIYHQTKETNYQ